MMSERCESLQHCLFICDSLFLCFYPHYEKKARTYKYKKFNFICFLLQNKKTHLFNDFQNVLCSRLKRNLLSWEIKFFCV